MRAIAGAGGDEEDVAGLERMRHRLDGLARRQRDRRRRQAGARVGVVRRVGAQVAFADVAVVGGADAVDHGGIGLQAHVPLRRRVTNTPAMRGRSLARPVSFSTMEASISAS